MAFRQPARRVEHGVRRKVSAQPQGDAVDQGLALPPPNGRGGKDEALSQGRIIVGKGVDCHGAAHGMAEDNNLRIRMASASCEHRSLEVGF